MDSFRFWGPVPSALTKKQKYSQLGSFIEDVEPRLLDLTADGDREELQANSV